MITTLEDLKNAKAHVERDVLFMLTEFAKESGCRITSVQLTTEEGFGIPPVIITNVKINIELP